MADPEGRAEGVRLFPRVNRVQIGKVVGVRFVIAALKRGRVVEGRHDHAAFSECENAAVPVVQYGINDRRRRRIALSAVLAVGNDGFPERADVSAPKSRRDDGNLSVLQFCDSRPAEIVVVTAGVLHDDFCRTDLPDSHRRASLSNEKYRQHAATVSQHPCAVVLFFVFTF